MKKVNDIWLGRANNSIGSLVKNFDNIVKSYSHVLISCIDSSRDLRSLSTSHEIVRQFAKCNFFNGSLILEKDIFEQVVSKFNLFNGFDEIWLFQNYPKVKIWPTIYITAPFDILSDIATEVIDWVKESGALLGLGDGIGLNYISADESTALMIEDAG